MNDQNAPFGLNRANFEIADPGTGNAIYVDRWNSHVGLKIAAGASETNTLAAPLRAGQKVTITAASVGSGGTRAVTVASAVDQGGDTVITFAAAGDYICLESVPLTISAGSATVYAWKVGHKEGVSGITLTATSQYSADVLKVGSVIVSPYKYVVVNNLLNSACIDQNIFIADRAYKVTACYEVHGTLGTNGSAVNVNLEKLTGTTAPGSGTQLLTDNTNAGFDCKATINTVQTGTLTSTAADLTLAAGDRLGLNFTGTVTALAGQVVTVQLKPV